jgi:hypothetical protein
MIVLLTLSLLHAASANFSLPIRMPNLSSAPGVQELYLCTYAQVPEGSDSLFITGFEPQASMSNAHHMLLYACDEPGLPAEGDEQALKSKNQKWDAFMHAGRS